MTKEHIIGVLYLECFQATQRIEELQKEVRDLREQNSLLNSILNSSNQGAGIQEDPASSFGSGQ